MAGSIPAQDDVAALLGTERRPRRPWVIRGASLLVLLAVVAAGVVGFAPRGGHGAGPRFRAAEVSRGDLRVTITATGTVQAITPPSEGRGHGPPGPPGMGPKRVGEVVDKDRKNVYVLEPSGLRRVAVRVGATDGTSTELLSDELASKGTSSFGPDQDDFVVMPMGLVQRRFTGSTDVGGFFVSAVSDDEVDHAKQQIKALLRERRRIAAGRPDDFSVEDTKQIANALSSVTSSLTALLGAIAAVSLLVGGIGIMNIMLVSVTERTRGIGLRMAIGAPAGEVLLQFLVEAVVLSTLGGLLGIAFGVGLSAVGASAFELPLVLSADVPLVAVGFSGAIGVAFGYFPARTAARLRPIEALRHE